MDRVCVVGLGYIGLPTALMLAANDVPVDAVDRSAELLGTLQDGRITFKEEGLQELYNCAVGKDIRFLPGCPADSFYIAAVQTPYIPETKKVDAVYVAAAVADILKVCPEDAVIVIESTVSPGTVDREIRPLVQASGKSVRLAHAPERIIPGNMLRELVHNSRTLGCDDSRTGEQLKAVYSSFCRGEIVLTDIRTAEMTKVVENAYRDVNIAYANELARICRREGLDVREVIRIANRHPRVHILQPGPGVGGHCISIDPWFLVGDFPEEARLIRTAREVNTDMPKFVLDRIQSILLEHGITDFARVGLYGLTYKENVDDTRESPTFQLLEQIRQKGLAQPAVYDPMVKKELTGRQYKDFDAFLDKVDLVVVMVGHQHIKDHALSLSGKLVFDTRCVDGLTADYTL